MFVRATCDLIAVRAMVATGLSLALATAAHVSAGGRLPALPLLLGMAVLCFVGTALWLGRETSRGSLALLLVAAQATIHFEMTALAGHGGHGVTATTATGALVDGLHHVLADLLTDTPMMAAHVAAAAATGLLLGHAERALFALLGLLRRVAGFVEVLVRVLRGPMPTGRPRSLRPTADAAPRRTSLLVATTRVRRGPPALLTAP